MIAFRKLSLVLLGLIALASLSLSLFVGNDAVHTGQLMRALTTDNSSLPHQILFLIRLPHALTAFITGGLLALAGALMQVLVRNPLADPYILGTSSGAALVTLLLMMTGYSGLWLSTGAWLGSLASILLVFCLCNRKNAWNSQQLLLTGIALACGFSALVSLVLFASPDAILRGMLFWLVGDLSFAHVPFFEGLVLLIGLTASLSVARDLNILVRGENEARALGVNTQQLQWKLYFLSSLLTATAVTLAGCIGFVGLIVPHLFRLFLGYDHRFLLPGCVLLGGSLLTLADLLARNLLFPLELPVGIVMTLIGIPIFILLLQKNAA
ncbi:MAG: iron ABC transporter permease [Gammaproteobacteria bacterium]|nr:iron ABC transporter permease [Gammaproteobacteria bacterium]